MDNLLTVLDRLKFIQIFENAKCFLFALGLKAGAQV